MMPRRTIPAAAVALFVISGSAHSAEKSEYSKTYTECMEKSGGVTVNMRECADAEITLQDTRLNKAYRELMKATSAKRQTQLRNVQRMWVAYRKANCDFFDDPDGGTLAGLSALSCFLTHTAARAKELEDLME
jgi:uncharacterized protein YecT (DUF1311 family)